MTRREPRLDPELLALLEPRRIERRAPPEVRSRALARARAIIASGGRIPAATLLELSAPSVARRRVPVWVAFAASVTVAAAAAGTLRSPAPGARPIIATSPTAQPPALVHDDRLEVAAIEPPQPAVPPAAAPSAARVPRASSDANPFSAELDLLARAHAAYTRNDFPRALALVAEHARRFPNGHLAEEREALRVRSLVRSGRSDDGHRAAAAFTQRFPRSVLLAHVEGSGAAK